MMVFCYTTPMSSQVTFVAEEGLDVGGLTREFFHILFRMLTAGSHTIQSRQVFHGHGAGRLLPSIDGDLVTECRVFRFIGIVAVQAARAGCPGPPGLCDGVRRFLASGARMNSIRRLMDGYVSIEDVADIDLRKLLFKVKYINLQRVKNEVRYKNPDFCLRNLQRPDHRRLTSLWRSDPTRPD